MLLIGSGAIAPATGSTQGKKTVATKKTTRSPKSTPPKPAAVKTTATRKPRAGKPRTAPPVVITDEDIRVRAYFLSIEYRGSNRGDIDFWLIAERELRPAKD